MAQVEPPGTVRQIFSSWRVEVVAKQGESAEMARERLRRVVEGSQPKITLQVRDPREVILRWVER